MNTTQLLHTAQFETANYRNTALDFFKHFQLPIQAQPTLDFLKQILQCYIEIPYENLSKIIKYNSNHADTLSLRMPEEVWHDFRESRLGGTCFSLTFLLKTILEHVGFKNYIVMARTNSGPNQHCALVIIYQDQHFLVDPGYVLDQPMPLTGEKSIFHKNAHTGVEIVPGEKALAYDVYTRTQHKTQWRYAFSDMAVDTAQFLDHWLGSFHWRGMHGICLTRHDRNSLIYVHNDFMRQTSMQGKCNFKLKKNKTELIKNMFGIPEEIIEKAETIVLTNRAKMKEEQANG